MDMDFEKYFQQKLKEDHEVLKNLPYTTSQLQEIYRKSYEYEKCIPKLEFKMEPQLLDYETDQYYLPEKWEVLRKGQLLSSDQELQRVLRLIVYNLGVQKTLSIIPHDLIIQYLKDNTER